jgi:signal transduction histidine kinase
MIRLYACFFFLFLLPSLHSNAQQAIQLPENFEKVSLANHLFFEVDYLENQDFERIKKTFNGTHIAKIYPNFDDSPFPHWIRFGVQNRGLKSQKVSLVTKGIDSLLVYVTNVKGKTLHQFNSGSHINIGLREIPSSFLCVSFELQPDSTYYIWSRIRNVHYRLAASPFDLYKQDAAKTYIFRQHFYYSLFIGSMFLFLLLGLFLAYSFKDKIYWYYLGCVVCALCIMLVYNDYLYLLLDKLPDIVVNKNILGVLSATVPVFYLLFAEQFLEISSREFAKTIRVSRFIILIQYAAMFGLIAFQQTLFEYKTLFYVFMGILSSINLVYLVNSWPSPQSKLFIFATLPVTVTVLLETLSNLHQWPVQNIHNAYYFTTFLELIALTAGLVYRFKKNEEEKYQLQNELVNVGFEAQRTERNQIADEMHNELGSILVVAKHQLQQLAQSFPDVYWQEVKINIDSAYRRVRELSQQLRSDDDYQLHLLLTEKYKSVKLVDFSFDGLEGIHFDSKIQVVLLSIISEIITNALKHAHSTYISVQISYNQPELKVIIDDDGVGFDQKNALEQGQGLKSIEKRITRNLKGSFKIDSGSKGTVIIIKADILPL